MTIDKTPAVTTDMIQVFNPATGENIGAVPSMSLPQATQSLEAVRKAQKQWAETSFAHRKELMLRFADIVYRRREEIAGALCAETGKTLYEAHLFEVVSLYRMAMYFGKKAEKILKPKTIRLSLFKNRRSEVVYTSRGVVMIIAPWNFPLAIPFGEVVMSLMAGNGVVLKPASLTPMIALKMKEIFDEAGFDPDIFQVVTGPGRMASQLIEQGVDYVNFTGSTAVGKKVAALCGSRLIPCSMELGGADPAIVLPDADLEKAAKTLVWGSFAASGQICASVERVYVHRSIHDEFLQNVVAFTKKLRQGNSLKDPNLDLGSMIDAGQVDIVEAQIADAVDKGADILTGGKRLVPEGMFFAPTVIGNATDDMEVVREETFGPAMPVLIYDDVEDAVARANHSIYGLSAYVFTRDIRRGREIAKQLQAGTVVVNDVLMTYGMPETPWGGPKESGIGRVHSDEGLRHLCETVHVNYPVLPFDLPVAFPYSRRKANMFWRVIRVFSKWFGQ